jgi:O-antigen/teichoic acid export membrane protein
MARPVGAYEPVLESGIGVASAAPRERALASNVVWLLGSNVIYAGSQWGAVVALAKFAPAASLGYFGLALAVTNPIVLVTGFSLKAFQSTDVLGRYRFADYVNLRLMANVVAGALVAAILALGVVAGDAARVLVPTALAKLADATSETCYGVAQKHDRMRYVAVSKAVRGACGLTALALVVAWGGSVVTGAWALAATWTVFLFVLDFPVAGSLEPVLGWPAPAVLWRLAKETAPLGGVSGIVALTDSLPRYLVQLAAGATAVGYYTALSSLRPVVSQFTAAVGNASAPRLGWAIASTNPARYRTLVRRLLAVACAASAGLALAAVLGGREFLRLAYTEDYGQYWTTFALIAVAAGFGVVSTVTYFGLVAARRLRLLLAMQCVELAVSGVVGFALIGRLGLDGAALGAALGAATMAAMGAWALLRLEDRR